VTEYWFRVSFAYEDSKIDTFEGEMGNVKKQKPVGGTGIASTGKKQTRGGYFGCMQNNMVGGH
jgi:hypothetical protein